MPEPNTEAEWQEELEALKRQIRPGFLQTPQNPDDKLIGQFVLRMSDYYLWKDQRNDSSHSDDH